MHEDLTAMSRQVEGRFGENGAYRFRELGERIAEFNKAEGAKASLRFDRDSGHVIITDSTEKFSQGALHEVELKTLMAAGQKAGEIEPLFETLSLSSVTERYSCPGWGWEIVLRPGEVAGQTIGVFENRYLVGCLRIGI
jgi:hypothetical protein